MSSVSADKLRELLSRMDQRDDNKAVFAMPEASKMLQLHDLSFRKLIEQIEERRLLLPSRIGTAIMMMDSTTANECESAFGAVRKMMLGCGLSFARIGEALDHKTVDVAELERVRAELQVQADNARRLQREVVSLRARSAASQAASGVSSARAFGSSLLSNGLVVVVGCAVLLWWFSMDRSTVAAMVAAPSALARSVSSSLTENPIVSDPSLHAEPPVRVDPRRAVAMPSVRHDARSGERSGRGYYAGPGYDDYGPSQCWRDRSGYGHCF